MQQISGLFFKDFIGFFRSYLGYAMVFVYLSVSSLLMLYGDNFFISEDNPLYSFFSVQPLVFSLIIPLLAAKVFGAEEDKSGNFEFLLTEPMKYKDVLLAKALSIFSFCLLLILLSSFVIIKLSRVINIDIPLLISSYIGIVGVAVVLTLLCSLINISVKNIFSACVISMLISVIYCNIDFSLISGAVLSLCGVYSPAGEYALSLPENYNELISGEISLPAVIFFAGTILLLAFAGYIIFVRKRGVYNKKEAYFSIFFAFMSVVLFSTAMKIAMFRYSIDLSTQKEYTLSSEDYDIIRDLGQNVHIKIYVSDKFADNYRNYEKYIAYVINIFEKYASASNKISMELINPSPYSVEADMAKQNGLEPVNDSDGNPLYFGAVFIGENNISKTIPLFLKERKPLLKNDISNILLSFSDSYKKPIIGIAAPNLPVLRKTYDNRYKQLALTEKLSEYYNLLHMEDTIIQIPPEVQTILLINPHNISDAFRYKLDQFVLMGGNVIIFADPYSEEEAEYKTLVMPKSSDLNSFLNNYGLFFSSDFVVANYKYAAKTLLNQEDEMSAYNYPLWLDLPAETIKEEKVKGKLSSLKLKTAGFVEKLEVKDIFSDIKYEPLLEMSDENGLSTSKSLSRDKELNKGKITNIDEKLILGMTAKGKFKSAFDDSYDESGNHLSYSIEPASVTIIADSDFLFNDAVIDMNKSVELAPYLFVEKNDNLQFLHNLISYVNGDEKYNPINNSVSGGREMSPNARIKQEAVYDYKERLGQISAEIANLNLKIAESSKIVNSFKRLTSPEENKKYNEMRTKRDSLRAEKMRIEYEVETKFESIKADLIIAVVFWLPLMAMLLILAGMSVVSFLKNKYIRRIMK